MDTSAGLISAALVDAAVVEEATRRTWAEVDLDALAGNVAAVREILRPGCALMAVVKADAYGHGVVPVARAALDAGASWLGVATVREGVALRRAGVTAPVLVLGAWDPAELMDAARWNLQLTIASAEGLEAVLRAAPPVGLHLKVDTGMTRLGLRPGEVVPALDRLAAAGAVVSGCYTHLATADDADPSAAVEQLRRFEAVLPEVRARFPRAVAHAANSAAALAFPHAHYDLVRIGLALYGLPPAPHLAGLALRPVLRLRSRVVRVARVSAGTSVSYGARYRARRETTIATVACGYADGYPRRAGEGGQVWMGGRRVPVAGTVCMDYLMADLGDGPAAVGEVVELLGEQVRADEVAARAGTVAYEVLCGIGPRVPRVYLRGGRPVQVDLRDV
ncbi:MAG: alanine racemase [Armatimonadota bacterium]|nr:alanine racemase [Armatimonadota bacterium]MDR7561363.1 alanine racemase [Armatimonadota bacterium]